MTVPSGGKIMLFSLNNAASNIYLFGFGYLSYYISGFLGLATVTIGYVLGAIRLFDGLIDPTIGAIMDNTNTKFGKYRPFMVFRESYPDCVISNAL